VNEGAVGGWWYRDAAESRGTAPPLLRGKLNSDVTGASVGPNSWSLWSWRGVPLQAPRPHVHTSTPSHFHTLIYLDHAATTPLDPVVLEVMRPYLTGTFGNPSSPHGAGRAARVAVEEAREKVAAVLRCAPAEIVFTSGGTEADNAALRGVLTGEALAETRRPGLVTSAAEHEAILRTAEALADEGHPVTVLSPGTAGAPTVDDVAGASGADTGLVSVMVVNNETGAVADVAGTAGVAHAAGALMHCDAVQAAGYMDLDVDALGVDLLSLSAHKVRGPKGAGGLFIRAGTPFSPLLRGGAQERRRRGGTENVAAIVGFGEALARADAGREAESARVAALRDRLRRRVEDAFGTGVVVNTPAGAASHILSLSFPPVGGRAVDGEMLLAGLDVAGVCASAGSACTSGALEPSHVLLAMGAARDTAGATLRFSMGAATTIEEIDTAAAVLADVVSRLR